eukprot:gb/GECG01014330.1/.p1 GENE.gb/GECG01014330.1/~~gb/GECG01014330.1/.p1  ORF type:complete len:108 (+),score=7.65 gb/GECG01014330.1/:1-324(+)
MGPCICLDKDWNRFFYRKKSTVTACLQSGIVSPAFSLSITTGTGTARDGLLLFTVLAGQRMRIVHASLRRSVAVHAGFHCVPFVLRPLFHLDVDVKALILTEQGESP